MNRRSRTWAWVSAAGVLLAALALSALIRQVTVANLVAVGERDTVALTHAFANSLGPEFLAWVDEAATLPLDALKAHPHTAALQATARRQLRGTDVAKIKVYALNGRTVFSTEAAQIGDSKAGNAGFQAARAGDTATELTQREKFSAFDQVVENRNLLSAYVPLRDAQTAQVRVVFELYSDVTPLVQQINRTQAGVSAIVAAVLGLLYALLFGVVRVSDRRLQRQYDDLQLASSELVAARDELERRVQERTAQLEHSHAGLNAAWSAAQRAQQQRCDALAAIDSEIRAPIQAVTHAGRALAAMSLDAQQRHHAEQIRSAAAALNGVLNQRLDPALAQSARARVEAAAPAMAPGPEARAVPA